MPTIPFLPLSSVPTNPTAERPPAPATTLSTPVTDHPTSAAVRASLAEASAAAAASAVAVASAGVGIHLVGLEGMISFELELEGSMGGRDRVERGGLG